LVPAACAAIVNAEAGTKKAAAGFFKPAFAIPAPSDGPDPEMTPLLSIVIAALIGLSRPDLIAGAQPFGRSDVENTRPVGAIAAGHKEFRSR
jgi:hypothetical protein